MINAANNLRVDSQNLKLIMAALKQDVQVAAGADIGGGTGGDLPPNLPIHDRKESFFKFAHALIAWPSVYWFVLDFSMCVIATYFAHRMSPSFLTANALVNPWIVAAAHAVSLCTSNYAGGLYNRHNFNSALTILRLSIVTNFVALAATSLFFWWVLYIPMGRFVVVFTYLLCTSGSMLFRLAARALATRKRIKILFAGNPAKFAYFSQALRKQYGELYDPPAYLDLRAKPLADRVDSLLAAFELLKLDEIVIEDDADLMIELLRYSSKIVGNGGMVCSSSSFHEDLLHEVELESLDWRTFLGTGWGAARHGIEFLKRSLDVLLSLFGFIVGAPVFLLVALAVKLTSAGPVIYSQIRVGRFGKTFRIYKFRTMRTDAEAKGAVWATVNDDRTTPIGKWLRKSRLDELPQLWNILIGNMSFVGPRPERPEFVSELEKSIPYYQMRHLVPPGLTGWAQIRYRYGASMEDSRRKLSYDLYYVRHYGITLDLAICLQTVVAMAKGAR